MKISSIGPYLFNIYSAKVNAGLDLNSPESISYLISNISYRIIYEERYYSLSILIVVLLASFLSRKFRYFILSLILACLAFIGLVYAYETIIAIHLIPSET